MKLLESTMQEGLLTEGVEYSVGTSDGKIFNRVVYKGTKSFGGKNMMCFETDKGSQLSINPSYNSFTIEENGQFPMPEDLIQGEK
tara:strand:+ start:90 stop:344 length:255 start_codon:yes stop_codon:yes gene_type:complete